MATFQANKRPMATVTAAVAPTTGRVKLSPRGSAQAWVLPEDQTTDGASVYQQHWQIQSWELNDVLGELGFVGESLATQASKAPWHVVVLPPEAPEPQPNVTPLATWGVQLADRGTTDRVMAALGDFSSFVYRAFYQVWLVGETWVITAQDGLVSASGYELRYAEDERGRKFVDRTLDGQWLPETTVRHLREDMFRVWKPHPARGWEADSSMRSARGVARTLVGLGMHTDAQISSRLSGNGVLWTPQGVAVVTPEGDIDTSPDALARVLAEQMSEPLENPTSPSAVVPLIVGVPTDKDGKQLLKPVHDSFSTPMDAEVGLRIDQAIRRVALSLSIEPEVLMPGGGETGSSSNHWQAWLTAEQTVTNHTQPGLWLLAEALNREILPHLGLDTDPEGLRVRFLPDVSGLIQRPDRFADAMRLYDAGAIDDSVVRAVAGYSDKDAPKLPRTQEEVASVVLDMLRKNPGLAQTPGVEYLLQAVEGLAGMRPQIDLAPSDAPDKSGAGAAGPGRPAAPDARPRAEDTARTSMPSRGARPTDDEMPL